MGTVTDLLSNLSSRRRTRNYDVTNIGILASYLEEYLVPIGTLVAKLTTTTPGPAWIRVEGQALSKVDYPDLYDEIGAMFGETAATFNLPNPSGAYLSGATTDTAGGIVGSNETTLTIDQMPAHDHNFADPGHTHVATSPPHTHGITDPGHAHAVGSSGAVGTAGPDTGLIAGNSGSSVTGLTIDNSAASVSVQSVAAGVTVDSQGGGATIDNRPRSIAVHYFIKART